MDKILFHDQQHEDKLEKAIQLGFIKKYQEPDNLIRYEITPLGINQWQQEMAIKAYQFHFSRR